MVAAYDSGTTRANEMLTVLDAILPLFLKQIVQDKKTEVSATIIKVLVDREPSKKRPKEHSRE